MSSRKPKKQGLVSSFFSPRSERIFLVKGKDATNRPAWYYVQVNEAEAAGFEAIQGKQSLNLSQYGTILLSGYGEEPPLEVRRKVEEEYGFRD